MAIARFNTDAVTYIHTMSDARFILVYKPTSTEHTKCLLIPPLYNRFLSEQETTLLWLLSFHIARGRETCEGVIIKR